MQRQGDCYTYPPTKKQKQKNKKQKKNTTTTKQNNNNKDEIQQIQVNWKEKKSMKGRQLKY
jgi:hypothetical protein